MPSNLHVGQNNFNQTVTTTSETLIAFIPAYTVNNPQGEGVYLSGQAIFTAPTGATACTLRVRQGQGTTGTVVGQPAVNPVTAGTAYSFDASVLDAFNLTSTLAYSLTIQFTGASANATINNAIITAESAVAPE